MGFLNQISGVFKSNATKANPIKRPSFFSSALQRYNLKTDVFEYSNHNTATAPQVKFNPAVDDNALHVPIDTNYVRFIRTYLNKATLEAALEKNPNIEAILKQNNLPVEYNLDNVNSIIMSHLVPCAKIAQTIYKNLGHSEKDAEYTYLTQAALLHDIGKAFIPSSILNKNGRLSAKEREIIELHNQLSYEILKTTDLNPRVAQLAYEHHNYSGDVKQNPENQALTVADVYCALRESRPYKKAMNDICAKTVLYDMGTKGNFDPKYITYIS